VELRQEGRPNLRSWWGKTTRGGGDKIRRKKSELMHTLQLGKRSEITCMRKKKTYNSIKRKDWSRKNNIYKQKQKQTRDRID